MSKRPPQQFDLFSGAPARPVGSVEPAQLPQQVHEVAAEIPPGVYLGTSSWSFPGWKGLVYDREASTSVLSRTGLLAYAEHPLFNLAGIDRTYYAPISEDVYAEYADQVPEAFRFTAKALEHCTVKRFPRHDRYGSKAGLINDLYLDVGYATDLVVEPFLSGLGPRGAAIIFQLPPQDPVALGGPDQFAHDLFRFLDALPKGPRYAVELRNRELFTQAYVDALIAAGAHHCINGHPRMPEPMAQYRMTERGGAAAVIGRWMLARHLTFESARARHAPFSAIVDEAPAIRSQWISIIRAGLRRGLPTFLIVNNKAEGSAPLSIQRLAAELVAG